MREGARCQATPALRTADPAPGARASPLASLSSSRLVVCDGYRVDGGRRDPPGCGHRELLGRPRRRGDHRRAECRHSAGACSAAIAAHTRARLPGRLDRRRSHAPGCGRTDRRGTHSRQVRLGSPSRAHRGCGERRARGSPRFGRHGLDPHRPEDRASAGNHRLDRRPGDRLPRDRRARTARVAAGNARRQHPDMARWARHTHRLAEWETDLSSQTGASQAGILLARTTTSRRSAGWRRRLQR